MLTGFLGHIQREAESSTTKHTLTGVTAPHCTFKGKKKRLKLTHKGEEEEEENSTKGGDMISGLPDEILSSILSLLPMKDEVKTSVLSTRWRFLWAPRPNLEFDIHTILGESIPKESIRTILGKSILKDSIETEEGLALLNSEYVRRVGNLLELCRAPKIYSFKVSYCIDQKSACHLDRWIESAIAMGVELLEINLSAKPYLNFFKYRSWYKPYNFPCLLLPQDEKTSTLKHLRLEFSILVCPPNFNGFNTLVTLELHEVKLNENCLESFFSSCLFLEILNMKMCTLPTKLKAVGPRVNLKCLEVSGCFGLKKILISARKLTSFKFCGRTVKISFYNVPRLKRLFIHSLLPISMPFILTRLPKDLPGFQSLYLSLTKEVPAKIASYSSLKEFELQVFPDTDLLWIISTINALPHLLKLNLKLVDHFRKLISTSGCPHNCLKEIEIYGFRPCSHTALVIYLLKNCVAMERMIINTTAACYSSDGDLRLHETFMRVGNENVSQWHGGKKEKLYEVLNREVPGRGELILELLGHNFYVGVQFHPEFSFIWCSNQFRSYTGSNRTIGSISRQAAKWKLGWNLAASQLFISCFTRRWSTRSSPNPKHSKPEGAGAPTKDFKAFLSQSLLLSEI